MMPGVPLVVEMSDSDEGPPPDLQELVRKAGERRVTELGEVYAKNPAHEDIGTSPQNGQVGIPTLFPLGGDYSLEAVTSIAMTREKATAVRGIGTGFPTPAPPTPTTPQMNVPHLVGSGTQRSLPPRSYEQSARHR